MEINLGGSHSGSGLDRGMGCSVVYWGGDVDASVGDGKGNSLGIIGVGDEDTVKKSERQIATSIMGRQQGSRMGIDRRDCRPQL